MKLKMRSISHNYALGALIVVSLATCGLQMANPEASHQAEGAMISNDSLKIGDAISYKNLQVFPIIAKSETDQPEFLLLSEAIRQQKVIVKETGSVNQLQIDNLSDDYVFILAGDIVKGGRQDRTMGNDVIIAPKTKDLPLESYCVESGRWQQRGEEESAHFSDNTKTLSSKDLKLASRHQKDQSEVWQKVSEEQQKLNRGLSNMKGETVEVKSAESETSLQLTLENKDLEDILKDYKNNLSGLEELPQGTVGYAYAVNGELYGIDIYCDEALFNSLKQKLFEAIIVETIAEYQRDLKFTRVDSNSILAFLNEFKQVKGERAEVNEKTAVITYETKDAVQFETKLAGTNEQWIRKNYLVKGDEQVQKRQNSSYQQRISE